MTSHPEEGETMPYQVVLIDDEPWTMVYMKKTFKWEDKGFEIIAETQNSLEAFDLIEQTRPDVVFTDIRMPEMSGIELMKGLRKKGVESEFVIASGFAEFEYAQEAVKLGAFEYCLKPISSEKADELLDRLALHLNARTDARRMHAARLSNRDEEAGPITEEDGQIKFTDMLAYIRCHYKEKLQLKDLAKQFYLNSNYCCHLFAKYTGKTFSEFLTQLRMEEAARLLQTHFTIEDVARKAGFVDYFYFNKVFKKYYGVTPTEFRKGSRSRSDA